ncbi:MAG: hypothetical protein ACFFCW_18005 [Candidatus Hodarchaeota archaeon]
MAKREDLSDWLLNALKANGGSATIVEVCKYVWENYEDELRKSGDLFYTWQYDIRWAATQLRKQDIMRSADASPKGIWELG